MDAMEAVKAAAKNTGVPLRHIGRKMGVAGNFVNKTIYRKSVPRANTLAKMLDACGYSLCAVPNDSVSDDMLVITARDDAGEDL